MWWWPLLFAGLIQARDEASERYCFSSPQTSLIASQNLRAITVPTDVITLQNECFTVAMKAHRRELIQNYLRNLYPDVKVSFSSAELKRAPCKLKVEKEKVNTAANLEGRASENPYAIQTTTESSSKDTMSIQTFNKFALTVNQDHISGECRFITAERYEINLEVIKEAKPSYPHLPSPDQQTARLSTTLQLTSGSRVEIGNIVKELKEKSQQVDLEPSLQGSQLNGQNQERVYLSLE